MVNFSLNKKVFIPAEQVSKLLWLPRSGFVGQKKSVGNRTVWFWWQYLRNGLWQKSLAVTCLRSSHRLAHKGEPVKESTRRQMTSMETYTYLKCLTMCSSREERMAMSSSSWTSVKAVFCVPTPCHLPTLCSASPAFLTHDVRKSPRPSRFPQNHQWGLVQRPYQSCFTSYYMLHHVVGNKINSIILG